jgi:membrane fusion protein, multidrug efflux system
MNEPLTKSKSSTSRWRRGIKIVVGLVIIVGIAVGVRQITSSTHPAAGNAAHSAPTVPVTAATATLQNVPEIIDSIGNVQSIDSVSVVPRVTGTIEKIEFTPGQDVKKGQELFLIDPRPYQAALDQAKAQLAHDQGVLAEGQTDLKRYQSLEAQSSIAAQTAQDQAYIVQQDQGTIALDQANVELAQLNLDYCHITAPISGRAGTLQVDLGNLVGPASGQANTAASSNSSSSTSSTSSTEGSMTAGATSSTSDLVSIQQLQPIYVNFSVSQTMFNDVAQNQAKSPLEVDAFSQAGKPLEKGKLTVIDNQVSTATGAVTLQATFANPGNTLWPGEYVSVQLVVGMRNNVVTVPASAVVVGLNGDYVYVIGAGNKVERVDVQQTARRGGISVIGKGISAGQGVVATGQYRLDNGTTVAIQQTTVPQQSTPATTNSGSTAAEQPQ